MAAIQDLVLTFCIGHQHITIGFTFAREWVRKLRNIFFSQSLSGAAMQPPSPQISWARTLPFI